jgi:hypothetical protein
MTRPGHRPVAAAGPDSSGRGRCWRAEGPGGRSVPPWLGGDTEEEERRRVKRRVSV